MSQLRPSRQPARVAEPPETRGFRGAVADGSRLFQRSPMLLEGVEISACSVEYVEGEPISSFCDRHCLSLRERVLLFRQVLLAVPLFLLFEVSIFVAKRVASRPETGDGQE